MDDNLWEPRELYWKIYAHGLAIERSIHGGIYITNAWNVDGCLMFFPNPYQANREVRFTKPKAK